MPVPVAATEKEVLAPAQIVEFMASELTFIVLFTLMVIMLELAVAVSAQSAFETIEQDTTSLLARVLLE
jgi:hypothetical protein